jgi:hypothetical protein
MAWWLYPLLISSVLFYLWLLVLWRFLSNRDVVLMLWVALVPLAIGIEVMWVSFGKASVQ